MNEAMTFADVYPNATMIDEDFLRNEFAYELYQLDAAEKKTLCRNYYVDMCAAVAALHYMHPSPVEIEAALERPGIRMVKLKTSVADPDERHYLFRCATAKQLQYDVRNGRTGMLRDAEDKYVVASDAYRILDTLGFVRRNYALKR